MRGTPRSGHQPGGPLRDEARSRRADDEAYNPRRSAGAAAARHSIPGVSGVRARAARRRISELLDPGLRMERAAVRPSGLRHLRLKVGALLLLVPLAIVALTAYALYARGVFEASRRIVLVARDVDGVSVGMPVTFSGFPMGSVSGMGLSNDGAVWVEVSVRERDARWLRTSSTFSLVRPLVGGARIRVDSPNVNDPPLPDGARGRLLVEDAMKDLPDIVARVETILGNVERLTQADSSLSRSLARLEVVTTRMAGENGILAGLTGSDDSAHKVVETIDRVAVLAGTLDRSARRLEQVIARADARLLGDDGVADEARKAMVQLDSGLGELRASVRKLDAALDNAQAATADIRTVSRSARDATADLSSLRREVDESVRRSSRLLRELDGKWPFRREPAIELP
ncbi:MAG: MCE family protein [Betaproteobacteria bacterium]|nr:MCE family protein [Betaproteobacteria bacterium]